MFDNSQAIAKFWKIRQHKKYWKVSKTAGSDISWQCWQIFETAFLKDLPVWWWLTCLQTSSRKISIDLRKLFLNIFWHLQTLKIIFFNGPCYFDIKPPSIRKFSKYLIHSQTDVNQETFEIHQSLLTRAI